MKKLLVIFGSGEIGQLAHYYFSHDSDYEVVAFTLDSQYITQSEFCGLPLVPFDQVAELYPPASYDFFVALSYSKLNQLRISKYLAAKDMGYSIASYISSRATVLTEKIGENCFILEDNTIQPFSTIGDNVTLWSGNHIGHHSIIHDHCFIASHVVVSGGVEIGRACFIGVNATLRNHIKIQENCVIGAGTLLLSDADSNGVYKGSETQRLVFTSDKLKSL